MEEIQKTCLESAAGEQMPNVLIKHEVEWLADHSHAPDLANQEVELDMEPIRSIKTEEDSCHTDAEAHAVQEFIPVPQTDGFIKAELNLDEEFIDKMSDSEENGKQLVPALADDNQAKASKSARTFSKKSRLINQLYVHEDDGNQVFPCDLCERTFSREHGLKVHKKAHTRKARTTTCEVCGSSYSSLTDLKIHMLRKHLDKLQSNISGSRTADDPASTHTEEFLDKDATSYGQESAAKGSTSQSDTKWECEVCHCIFPREYIRIHKRLAHSKPKYKCHVCSRTFKKIDQLKMHLSTHATNRQREFTCDVCERSFYTKGQMTRHKKLYAQNGHPTFNCEVCGSSFAKLENRKIHMLKKHLDTLQSNISGPRTADNDSIDSQMEEFLEEETTSYVHASEENTARHSEIKSDVKSEACEVCHCIFPTEYIGTHMRLAHYKPKYKCEICSRTFKKKSELERHLSTHDTDRKRVFACGICERAYYSKSALDSHQRRYAQKDHPKFYCKVCGATFKKKGQLDLHLSTKHSDQSQPIIQAAQPADHNSMNTNQMLGNKRTEGKKFQCGVCSRTCKTKNILKNHLKIHDKNRKREFACNSCDNTFYSNSTLWTHKKIVHNQDTYQCKVCDQRFRIKESLKVHMLHRQHFDESHKFRPQPSNDAGVPMKTELTSDEEEFIEAKDGDSVSHAEGSQQPAIAADDERSVRVDKAEDSATAEVCHNSYPADLIETHMRITNGDATYKCQLCPRIFLHISELKSHIRGHDDKDKCRGPCVCEQCGDTFATHRSVKRHMAAKHSDQSQPITQAAQPADHNSMNINQMLGNKRTEGKKFQCGVCSRTCKTKNILKNHLKIHDKDRKREFACNSCDSTFYSNSTLWTHKKIVHNQDTYQCKVCDQRFRIKESLKVHMLHRQHFDESQHFTRQPSNDDGVPMKTELTSDEEEFIEGKDGDSVSHAEGSQHPAIAADDERSVRVDKAEDSATSEVCHNTYPADLIETHMRITNGDATYKCQLCPRIFLHISELKSHIRGHDDKDKCRECVCEQCGDTFATHRSVKRHMATKHTKSRLPEFNCELCEKKFYSKNGFEQHKRRHTDDAISCQVCGARFTHKDSLKYHMLHEHTDKRKQFTPNPPTANYDAVRTKKESTSDEEFLGEET